MCARYSIALSTAALQGHFGLEEIGEYEPVLNAAPTEIVPAIIRDEALAKRTLVTMKWGLVPFWQKGPSSRGPLINTRSETVLEKPAFREAVRKRRCLLPASGFYEWKDEGGKKQPYYIYRSDSKPFAFAGIFERARHEQPATCALLTKASSGKLSALHDRVPVIVDERDYELWLSAEDEDRTVPGVVAASLEADRLTFYRVTPRMSRAGYREPDCIEPLSLENSAQGGLFG